MLMLIPIVVVIVNPLFSKLKTGLFKIFLFLVICRHFFADSDGEKKLYIQFSSRKLLNLMEIKEIQMEIYSDEARKKSIILPDYVDVSLTLALFPSHIKRLKISFRII